MIRTNIHFTKGQLADLQRLSDKTGLSMAELVRRAVDDMLDRERKKGQKDVRSH
jgi:hypothetical protein